MSSFYKGLGYFLLGIGVLWVVSIVAAVAAKDAATFASQIPAVIFHVVLMIGGFYFIGLGYKVRRKAIAAG